MSDFILMKTMRVEELKRINSTSRDLFLRYGFKSVTMNDISQELGMSKKTLYQYVDNKEDLIKKVVADFIEEDKEACAEIFEKAGNAIEEMHLLAFHVNLLLQKINPSAIYDLNKYYRNAKELVEDYKRGFVADRILDNMKRGMDEGFYRKELDAEVIIRLYLGMFELIMDGQHFPFPKFNQASVQEAFLRYHIRGIATEKGIKLLNKYEKLQKN